MEDEGKPGLPAPADMDPRRLHRALTLLSKGEWWTPAALVRETAAPRRAVEALLAEIGPERSGDRFRLGSDQVRRYAEVLDAGRPPFSPADPVEHLLPEHAAVVERLHELIERAPRSRQALDHVAATPETVVRRALLLGARFWLRDTRLLCVGDHDLTSLAIGMIHPHVQTTVVDIDERILAFIDSAAAGLGLDVRTRWADLRLGLAPAARGYADLAITDPPYSPDGIGLFVARAIEGLREPARGRVLLAYGASERTPMLALKVQKALLDLNVVSEAVYPDFNRYFGAEAIGSAADLYILRPTTKSLPAATARSEQVSTAIYTQGPQAVESREPVAVPVDEVTAGGFQPDALVGGWPKGVLPKLPRVRLTTWLAKPYAARLGQVAVALPAGLESALPRVLLATRAGHLRVYTAEEVRLGELAKVLDPVYELAARGGVLEAVRRPLPQDEAERVVRTIMDRAHGKIANSWRDALIVLRPELNKRQARTVVDETAPWAKDVTLLELPLHRLRDLLGAVRDSLVRAERAVQEAVAQAPSADPAAAPSLGPGQ
ncbi:bis-aminopropyl spermidine synthase family protein [Actinomadura rubrisoli]|uniref:Putative methyltransferase n=1 Tax=Actinomadura rubrisoli TaxID=2530368 RepID=A0A4R5A8S0_9ACTN|nr:bis-aminopropyl spermidine synthase family protein [Actinomadura rubrisoli]TDD68421.1 putative methyltransferase [Actinomadura rubrisoli]